ncbi:hypothetical protein [Microcella sp.]|uniref:hypothetical protein n=1 Tax=Microcella sp. TaxID=1913979 RepID=UPI00299F5BD5|nr:hypothetical protein [Microcella sp.]MDX2024982.1 hypothetical protein [Microcella sp.]
MEVTLVVLAIILPFLLVLGITIAYVRKRQASARRFALAQEPSTITLIGVRDGDFRASLAQALEYGGPSRRVPLEFLVTIAPGGMTFWTFARSPQTLFEFPAARVLDVAVGTVTERPEYRLPARARLALLIAPLDDSASRKTVLQFTASEVHRESQRLRFAGEVELDSIADRARGVLGVGGPSPGD